MTPPRSIPKDIWKRCFDSCVALILLCVTLPALCIVAVLIRSRMGAPILFRQQRPGLHGSPFTLYKFRTMGNVDEASDAMVADEWRLTRLGRALRRLSIDELPQLINVLKGDMSLVGPRPLLTEYLPLYTAEQARRHAVRPGITGWAQVNGRNAVSWEQRFRLDVWYVDHRSFCLDLHILWLTLVRVLRADGISEPGNVTMSKFTGNEHGE